MSSNKESIFVENITKKYQIYDKPLDRLKQIIAGRKKTYYREFNALNTVSFTINKGETLGIIGVNGSGKSTLLQILANTLAPTTGKVKVNGRVAALLELGSGFNPEFTGRENIFLNGSILGVPREEMEKKYEEIIQFADIGEFIDQPVKTYSSGMYVRLAFAVAINVDADILIVDEALAVGDVFFQAKCYKKIDEIKKSGKTILLVTHDLGSIIKYCNKVMVLHRGNLVGIGNAKEMVDIYKKIEVNEYRTTVPIPAANQEINDSKSIEGNWLSFYPENKNCLEYGNGGAKIIDVGIFDESDKVSNKVDKSSQFKVKMKVKFNKNIKEPIFAFTFKDLKGTEITGTNTMIEKINLDEALAGEIIEVHFVQNMNLQGGNYLISFGCTGFENNNFVVYNRLYDIFSIQVVSEKNSVGYFDMNSKVYISREETGE